MRTQFRAAACVLVVGCIAATACASGDPVAEPPQEQQSTTVATPDQPTPTVASATPSPTPTAESPSPSPTSEASASPSASPKPTADSETEALAVAGTLQESDFGEGWSLNAPGAVNEITDESCSQRAGGATTQLPTGAVQDGPSMKFGDGFGFATTTVYVLPTDEAAVQLIAAVNTPEWVECTREFFQTHQDENASVPVEVRLETRDNPTQGQPGGSESFVRFVLTIEGSPDAYSGYEFFRAGRVVIRLGLDTGSLSETDGAAYKAAIDGALQAAVDRVNGLLGTTAG